MSHRQTRYVLDASALIAFLTAEEGGLTVAQLISDAQYKQTTLHITAVNLFEVYYDYLKRGATTEEATQLLNEIYDLPITIANTIDRPLLEKAAELKTTFKISVADSFALALAKHLQIPLVTSDHHEFDAIEAAGDVQFYWIR